MSDNKDENTTPPTALGWAIRLVSLAFIAALAIYIGTQIAAPDRDISLAVEAKMQDAREQSGQVLLPVELTNKGTATIRHMTLELAIGSATREVQILMLGQDESMTFVLDVPEATETVGYKILSYEAP